MPNGNDMARRIASRYASGADEDWVAANVIDQEMRAQIHDFAQGIVVSGRATHLMFDKKLRAARQAVEGGDKVRMADIVAAVRAELARTWGEDAMTPRLALVIAQGEFVW